MILIHLLAFLGFIFFLSKHPIPKKEQFVYSFYEVVLTHLIMLLKPVFTTHMTHGVRHISCKKGLNNIFKKIIGVQNLSLIRIGTVKHSTIEFKYRTDAISNINTDIKGKRCFPLQRAWPFRVVMRIQASMGIKNDLLQKKCKNKILHLFKVHTT